MSIDASSADEMGRPAAVSCALCDHAAGSDGRSLACYATDGVAPPEMAAADGLLELCGTCTAEVRELTVAWDAVEWPVIDGAATIAEQYRSAADRCSFCEDRVDEADVLGLESWQPGRGDDPAVDDHVPDELTSDDPAPDGLTPDGLTPDGPTLDDLEHYVLCGTCVPIFAEFLDGITDDA